MWCPCDVPVVSVWCPYVVQLPALHFCWASERMQFRRGRWCTGLLAMPAMLPSAATDTSCRLLAILLREPSAMHSKPCALSCSCEALVRPHPSPSPHRLQPWSHTTALPVLLLLHTGSRRGRLLRCLPGAVHSLAVLPSWACCTTGNDTFCRLASLTSCVGHRQCTPSHVRCCVRVKP